MRTITFGEGVGLPPGEEEAAAVAAALTLLFAEQVPPAANDDKAWGWRATGILVTQGMVPSRPATHTRWNTIERLRRVGRGGSGIIGL
jgi:hypothetical protein